MSKHPLTSINPKEIFIQAIKSIQGTKASGKLLHDLLKYIFIIFNIIRSLSDHAVLSWIYRTHEYFISVKTDDILMAKQNRVLFEILIK